MKKKIFFACLLLVLSAFIVGLKEYVDPRAHIWLACYGTLSLMGAVVMGAHIGYLIESGTKEQK